MNWVLRLWVVALLALAAAPGVVWADRNQATKIADDLASISAQHAAAAARGVVFRSANRFLPVANDLVTIDAVAAGDPRSLEADFRGLGAQHVKVSGRIVSARLPISAISMLESLANLRFAQPAYSATHAGSVTSQGDRAMRADVARAALGVTGAGVTVGVLSDSFNCRGGAAADVATGDLSPVTVLQDEPGCGSGTDEGRAMLQIVHDVAPGAGLSFATAFAGMASFAANIRALAAAGARVIVDDVIYFGEPMFQDGVIAQAVDSVAANGVAYFSAAGNYARQSYDHAFVAGTSFPVGAFGPGFIGGIAHDFGGGDFFQRVTLPPSTSFLLVLQWDSPTFSVGGIGTPNDVDVYIFNAAATQVISAATTNNVASGDPIEFLSFVNSGAAALDVNIMIVTRTGPNPGRIKYVLAGDNRVVIQEFATNSGTIYGHANAQGAAAVGAAFYGFTPEFGVSPPSLESFSSGGTTPILFDTAGARLGTLDPRANKPLIVAPDGGDTTFFGTDIDGSGFPNFFGTSAAAPHAAAVAALVLQAAPTMTPAQVLATLQSTARDMGTAGFDNDTGFGLIQADAALMSLLNVAGITPNPIDLASAPTTFTIAGQGFAESGFGLPVANFMSGGTLVGQARGTGLTGSTALTVPFPTNATSLNGPLPGLTAGTVQVQVYNQTGSASWALVGSITLTVNDTRPCPLCVTGISPTPIDLASAPTTFTIAGQGLANNGFGLPVANFMSGGTIVGQARATGLTGSTTLTVPFPTNTTSLNGPLPGLRAGTVQVQVYNQTGSASWAFVGSITLTVNDTRPCALCVTGIAPNPIDLASAPAAFTIAGQGLADNGFGLPVANFVIGGSVVGQARATQLTSNTTLTVPFPANATSLNGPLPGLAAGQVLVQVYNQTGVASWAFVGSITLTVNDTRPCPLCVRSISPNPIDLASSPASLTITGGGFTNSGFGLPVANFTSGGTVVGQARATGLSGNTMLTVPFPTNATSLNGPLPGLAAGAVQVQVFNQTGAASWMLVGSITLTVNATPSCAQCVSADRP